MKKALIISSRGKPTGFFSLYFQVLGWLEVCEEESIIPIVYWRSNCVYWEKRGYRGKRNPWEYYFHPVSKYSITDFTNAPLSYLENAKLQEFNNAKVDLRYSEEICQESKRKKIFLPKNVRITNVFLEGIITGGEVMEQKRKKFSFLIRKYVKIRKEILEKIHDFEREHFKGNKVIGIHLRGKEKMEELALYHKIKMVPPKYYFQEVNKYLKKEPSAKVFIATESKSLRKQVKEKYGKRVVYYDSTLSDEGTSPHLQFGGAKVGEEVLIEAMLLSKCNFLVYGMSEVPFAATYFNPTLRHVNIQKKKKNLAKWLYYLDLKLFVITSIKRISMDLDGEIGKIGLFLNKHSPRLYVRLKKLKMLILDSFKQF